MNRKIYYWKLRSTELQLGERTLIMGVLNVTPDSFSDGGRFLDPDLACARALEMEEHGADIIDLGAESTRPESRRISADEEWQRLVPVLKRLRGKLGIPLSLDTYKSETAERALEYGVEIINDPSGLTFDAGLAKVAATANAGLILNHMRGTPETWGSLPPLPDVTGSVLRDLDATTSRARRAGVEKNRIVVDPGLGFGKRKEQNSEVIAQLGRLAELDYPLLAAPSRKAFLTQAGDTEYLVFATAAAVTAAVLHGAHIVRVHDVKEMRAVVAIADEINRLATPAVKVDEEAAERKDWRASARVATPSRSRVAPAWLGEEKHPPMRPPLQPAAPRPVAVAAPVSETLENGTATETENKPDTSAVELTGAAAPEPAATEAPVAKIPDAEAPDGEAPDAEAPAVKTQSSEQPVVKRPPQSAPSKGWGPPAFAPRNDSGARPPKPAFGANGPGREYGAGGPKKEYGDRPPRQDFGDRDRGPRPPFGAGGPRKDFGDRPPRKDFGDRGPRPPFGAGGPKKEYGDRPPRQDFGDRDRGPRPPFGAGGPKKEYGDRPPRQDFGDRDRGPRPPFGAGGPRKDFGDRPPRKDFGDRGPRPPFGAGGPKKDYGDRPPRKDFGDRGPRPSFGAGGPKKDYGDRPPRKDFGDRGPRPPFGAGGPKKDYGDRPPRKDFGDRGPRPAFGAGGPKRDFNDRPQRPPFGDRPRRESGPPSGRPPQDRPPQRPFRKRP